MNAGNNFRQGKTKAASPCLVGDNAIVGGGAIVTKDVAPNTAVAGNPAKVIRQPEPPAEGGGKSLSDAASLL